MFEGFLFWQHFGAHLKPPSAYGSSATAVIASLPSCVLLLFLLLCEVGLCGSYLPISSEINDRRHGRGEIKEGGGITSGEIYVTCVWGVLVFRCVGVMDFNIKEGWGKKRAMKWGRILRECLERKSKKGKFGGKVVRCRWYERCHA